MFVVKNAVFVRSPAFRRNLGGSILPPEGGTTNHRSAVTFSDKKTELCLKLPFSCGHFVQNSIAPPMTRMDADKFRSNHPRQPA